MVIISSASFNVRFYTRFLASSPSFGRTFERVDSANVRFTAGLGVSWLQMEKEIYRYVVFSLGKNTFSSKHRRKCVITKRFFGLHRSELIINFFKKFSTPR